MMRKILYIQNFRSKHPERQQEIDRCLANNLHHPGLDKVVVLQEEDAPPIPKGTVTCEVIDYNERLTYSHWLSLAKQEPNAIALLVNSDIYLAEGLDHLDAVFDSTDTFLALSRYNPEPGSQRLRLNTYPHWTQYTLGIRSDAPIPQSLLSASSFPLGFPGCDNRIAYVMWSHGFAIKNPAYFVKSVHEHRETSRPYDTHADRLYGGVSYVHLNLYPAEASELEHTIWTRSAEIGGGVLVNQKPIGKGVHRFVAANGTDVDLFQQMQKFTGLSWMHQAQGSTKVLVDSMHTLAGDRIHVSDHTVSLPVQELTTNGVSMELPAGTSLLGVFLRLPRHSAPSYGLAIEATNCEGIRRSLLAEEARIEGLGRRNFIEGARVEGTFTKLTMRLRPLDNETRTWSHLDLAELVLFSKKPAAAEPAKPADASPAEVTPPAAAPVWGAYTVIDRKEFLADGSQTVKRFGSRFEVLSDGEALYFVDRYWPTVGRIMFQGSAQAALAQGEEALFAAGFLQPVQEWKPEQITSEKKYRDQRLFWQYPCRTEEDAYLVHKGLSGPQREGDAYQVYLGMPWATFIDRGVDKKLSGSPYPETLLLAHGRRAEALVAVLKHWGRTLQVHSICQHIHWRKAATSILSAGVTDLWLSHKEKGLDEEQGLRLHSWGLYAVNDRTPARRMGLHIVPIEQRPVFASFSGAHMQHYVSDVRQRLRSLVELEGYRITINNLWHFNKVVYNFQVFGDESKKDAIEANEVRNFNELLSHTRFSLCPGGAGPNTLRLWESLAVGAIPVVLSDRHQLPDLTRLLPGEEVSWDQVLVLHSEAELEKLDARLRAIDGAELQRRQRLCRRVYEASMKMTCFGRSTRQAEPIPLLLERFKAQQVQVPGQTAAESTRIAHLVPASLRLDTEGSSSIVVILDQTEELLGFQLTVKNCTLEQVSFRVSRYREFNKFEDLPLGVEIVRSDCAWLWLPQGQRWEAMGLKLTAELTSLAEPQPPVELHLAVLCQKHIVDHEATHLAEAGIFKAESDRNAERKNDTFDTKNVNGALIQEWVLEVDQPAESKRA